MAAAVNPQIEESWKRELAAEFEKEYFARLKEFLLEEKGRGAVVYPPGPLIFNAFNHTPFDKVKVVILGQDPYHGPGQAHGLCFSVQRGMPPPPSLQNMFKELREDLKDEGGFRMPNHGNLEAWADQGVFLLNSTLTVRAGAAASHAGKGWEEFTAAAVRHLSEKREGLIFLLWGRHAQAKEPLIDTKRHHVLKAAHPSPLSAYNGFFGCRHFSKANALLKQAGQEPIDWQV
ncbi:MAG TPA: uracil-DNA glycosylase [Fibrobacteria bacterium]|nr:uracil-DNA glycosylase [Fibrobacteria bacterium]